MTDRYFKKSKDKFKVGYSSKVFQYDFRRHKVDDLEERFIECDANGNEVKKEKPKVKAKPEAKQKEGK